VVLLHTAGAEGVEPLPPSYELRAEGAAEYFGSAFSMRFTAQMLLDRDRSVVIY
jgi:hypothetical protein